VLVSSTKGGVIEVAREHEAPGTIPHLIPSLPGSSLTLAASAGIPYDPPFALGHLEGLAP